MMISQRIHHSLTTTLARISTSSKYIHPSSTTFTMLPFGWGVLTRDTSSCSRELNLYLGFGLKGLNPYLNRICVNIRWVISTPCLEVVLSPYRDNFERRLLTPIISSPSSLFWCFMMWFFSLSKVLLTRRCPSTASPRCRGCSGQ